MSFVDPYIDTETGLLINSIGAKTQSELDQIEADFVSIGLLKLYDEKFRVSYSLEDLQYIRGLDKSELLKYTKLEIQTILILRLRP